MNTKKTEGQKVFNIKINKKIESFGPKFLKDIYDKINLLNNNLKTIN